MATHSSILAWRIPGTGEPGGLPSMGSHRVGHNWSDLGAAAAAARATNCPAMPKTFPHDKYLYDSKYQWLRNTWGKRLSTQGMEALQLKMAEELQLKKLQRSFAARLPDSWEWGFIHLFYVSGFVHGYYSTKNMVSECPSYCVPGSFLALVWQCPWR